MEKRIPLSLVMKVVFLILMTCSFPMALTAQSSSSLSNPYYYMESNQGSSLVTQIEKKKSILTILFHGKDGELMESTIDYNQRKIIVKDRKGKILSEETLSFSDNAFSVIDPCTERYSQSNLFAALYDAIDASQHVFKISYSKPVGVDGTYVAGQFITHKSGGGSLIFDNSIPEIPNPTLSEEFFHAYQYDNQGGYGKGDFNREFEAKAFATIVGLQMGTGGGIYNGMETFQNNIIKEKYGKDPFYLTPTTVMNSTFLNDYMTSANQYSQYNTIHQIGNQHYRQPTSVQPYGLQQIVRAAYK